MAQVFHKPPRRISDLAGLSFGRRIAFHIAGGEWNWVDTAHHPERCGAVDMQARVFFGDPFSKGIEQVRRENCMRSIALHFEPGTTNVDGFACSACDWFYVFTSSEADGSLCRREVDEAHALFAAHACSDYPKASMGDDTA